MLVTKINTLLELRQRRGKSTAVIELLGLASINDENGGFFYWDNASQATDDGDSIIEVAGVTIGRWIRINRNKQSTSSQVEFTDDYFII